MLELIDLHVRYGGIHAVQGISLRVRPGEIVTLIGANGAGKSSTVRAVAGLVRGGLGGRILYTPPGGETVSLAGLPPEKIVARGLALCPEGRRILPHLTVAENLELGAYSRSDRKAVAGDKELVYALFPLLRERHWQPGGTLSGGEQQMLAVGRALMSRPDLLMLDEPSLGLAPILVQEIFQIIGRINQEEGRTILLIEQNAHAALSIAHQAYILEVGNIVLAGPGKELLHDPKVKEAYLGG
ncbi:MAG: ABC transporter ATP-binding protein [Deltaproteobacteria bacterium]|jgi:branched-chain amino acid transport system ATP-binding protein|nr:ABC transporter ATP-binding protein [Deltaproteobacteria bacterium]